MSLDPSDARLHAHFGASAFSGNCSSSCPSSALDRELAVEWRGDDSPTTIPIEQFPFDGLDSLDDLVREELRTRGTVTGLFERLVEERVAPARHEAVAWLIGVLLQAKKPRLAVVQIAFAVGVYESAGKTGTELAEENGISKQAFEQGVSKYRLAFGLRKNRTMRDEEACERMSLNNFRRAKV